MVGPQPLNPAGSVATGPSARPNLVARVWQPVLVGVLGLAAVAAVGLRDPHVPGSWGTCPFLQLTGFYCPGCGGLRGVHDLVHLRPLEALHSNALGMILVVGGGLCWLIWLIARVRGRPAQLERFVTPAVAWSLLGFLIVFSVLRNTPWGTWLAP